MSRNAYLCIELRHQWVGLARPHEFVHASVSMLHMCQVLRASMHAYVLHYDTKECVLTVFTGCMILFMQASVVPCVASMNACVDIAL